MKMKNILMSGLLFLGVLSAQAQAPQAASEQQGTTEYVFNPHWYVQVQPLGLQYTLGEVDFGDLISYNLQVGAGYNFNRILGTRLSVNAWQSKAGIDDSQFNSIDPRFKGKWSWKYVAPSLDLTFNLSNLVSGINPSRLFDLSAFVGVGLNIAFSNDDAWKVKNAFNGSYYSTRNENVDYCWDGTKVRVTGRAGLQGDFHITEALSAGLEVNANLLSDRYNSKRAGNPDWYFNAYAGIKYNLGATYTTKFTPAPEPQVIYKEVEPKVVYKEPEPATAAVEEVGIEPLRRDIFFKINSFVISKAEQVKVKEIADYLNQNPNAKVAITGYADAGTGNDRINDRLAAQRADAVVKALTRLYKIPASRITSDSKGARVQPFAENDMNRVSICIAE